MINEKPFCISIKPLNKCLFARRNGFFGKKIFKYSVVIRLFGVNITKN